MKKLSVVCFVLFCLVFAGCAKQEVTEKQEPKPFFEEHGLMPNAEVDGGVYELGSALRYHMKDGSNYQRVPGEWEVKMVSDTDMGDGTKELVFEVYCYFRNKNHPQNGSNSYGCSSDLYDYYTGTYLPAKSTKGNTTDEQNTYSYAFDLDGEQTEIAYSFSTSWDNGDDSCHRRLIKKYTVRCPKDYDGLVFCAHQAAKSYEESQKDKEDDEGAETPITIVEHKYREADNPDNTLRFRIK